MSGTGKTLAAEVLGNTLRLDVYRIDLSAVQMKHIKQAAIQECLKMECPMGQGELQGW
jgi:hypothetical protein